MIEYQLHIEENTYFHLRSVTYGLHKNKTEYQ